MAPRLPAVYTARPTSSSNPTSVVNLPFRETAPASASPKTATVRSPSNGHRVIVKLPPSPSPSTTPWSLDTPEREQSVDEDQSSAESESEYSSDDKECEELTDEDLDDLSYDGDKMRDDEDGEESSEDDGEEFDDEIPKEELASLLSEANEWYGPIAIPHTVPATLPGTVAAEGDDKDGEETTQTNVTKEGSTAGKREDQRAASAPIASRNPPPFAFKNVLTIAATSDSQTTPGRKSIWNFTAASNKDFEPTLRESRPMNLSNSLLLTKVFKIQEIDRESHPCRGLDAQGAQCRSSVPGCHSLSIKLYESSLEIVDEIGDTEIKYLARYNMCDAHSNQSVKLAQEWIRLAKLTEAARKYWLNQAKSLSPESQDLRENCANFAAAEVRRILEQDEIVVRAEKEKTELNNESKKTITRLRTKIENLESQLFSVRGLNRSSKKSLAEYLNKISGLEKQINNLTTENSSRKQAQESIENALAKEREHNQRDLLKVKDLHELSQNIIEALHKQISALIFKVGELTTENSFLKEGQAATEAGLVKERKRSQQELQDAQGLYKGSQEHVEALGKEVDTLKSCISELKNSLESTQHALTKEKVRTRELEIRLEERVALGSKTQDSHETKLEKYLRDELDASQRRVLQQQKEFEKLREDHVRLQITNATLESQVKQTDAAKEELSRASNREFQELAERNSDLSNQLHHTRAQLEQLKAALATMEKGSEGETSKSKFSLRDMYRWPKHERSRSLTPHTDQ